MIMTNLYMGSHVTNERFLSKDQVIAELKSRIDCLENEKVRRCNENINRMSENMQLHQELEQAQEEISYLKHELKISKKYIEPTGIKETEYSCLYNSHKRKKL